ncbi:MAG: hypothetical protein EHM23_16225 [Acidobacteria bacterium]|nr:MAG: hypothetical protein EHM23_16225 [Acidobacteriota bacterium]
MREGAKGRRGEGAKGRRGEGTKGRDSDRFCTPPAYLSLRDKRQKSPTHDFYARSYWKESPSPAVGNTSSAPCLTGDTMRDQGGFTCQTARQA